MTRGGRPRRLAGVLGVFFLLSACNTADDTSTAPTTGQESAFQLTGDVSAVDVEDVDVDVDVSAGPDGIDIDPSGSVTVQLTVNLESINDEAAQLCGLQAGRDATVVVTDETDLDVDRPLAELGTIQDESITASGTARQLVGSDASANEPAGNCTLAAASLALAEEPAAEGSPTPVA